MKIVEDYNNDAATCVIEVISAVYVDAYTIKVTFNDRSEKEIDFKSFLSKSLHPSISKYLDEPLFKSFNIKYGNLNWNDYDLIFPVYDLYRGEIN